MNEATIKYKKEDLKILWKPSLCIHSTKCWKGLPEVFNPRVKPWVNAEGASKEKIIEHIKQCPSGALSFELINEKTNTFMEAKNVKIQIAPNGPLLVDGSCVIVNKDGKEEVKEGKFALCRCGKSSKKPYCDGAHKTLEFDV